MESKKQLLFIISIMLSAAIFVIGYTQISSDQKIVDRTPKSPKSPLSHQPPAPVEPKPATKITLEEAVQTITEAECKEYVYKLADKAWEGRMSGKKGNVLATTWVKKYHEDNGLPTEYQKFSIRRLNAGPHNERGNNFTQNLSTWIKGSDPSLGIVVLGAHLDHIGYGPSMSRSRRIAIHPGADDNASGTAAIMEVAEALSKMGQPKRTILIQHYSGEEMGLIGSRYYCDNPTFPKNRPSIEKHVAMVNLDMVGYLNQGIYFAGWGGGDSSIDIKRYIQELNGKYTFASGITSRGGGGSDHASFYNKRIPVAFLHTGTHPHYHTPTDTADRINYAGMEKVTRYTLELVWKIANADSSPRFNVAKFKVMEYKHDHGHPDTPFIHPYHHSAP